MDPTPHSPPQARPVLIHQRKGVLYRDQQEVLWQTLLDVQAMVRDYVAVIGLELILDEAEGYAFLRQREPDAEEPNPLPRVQTQGDEGLPLLGADHANTVLAAGRADLAAMARPHLRNPYLTLHAAERYEQWHQKWPDQYQPAKPRAPRSNRRRD